MYPPVSTGVDPGIDLLPKVKGYITIICNNIIVNTQKSTKDPSGQDMEFSITTLKQVSLCWKTTAFNIMWGEIIKT